MFFRKKKQEMSSPLPKGTDIIDEARKDLYNKKRMVEILTQKPIKASKDDGQIQEKLEMYPYKPNLSSFDKNQIRWFVKYTVNTPDWNNNFPDPNMPAPISFSDKIFDDYNTAKQYFFGLVRKYGLELEDHHNEFKITP